VVEVALELLSLFLGETVGGCRGGCRPKRRDGSGRCGSELRWPGLNPFELKSRGLCGRLLTAEVEERLPEAGGGDGDGGGGATEGEAVAAPGAEVDERVDRVEHFAGGVEQIVERHEPEVIGEDGDMAAEGVIFFERAAAMRGAMGRAEALAAFGDTAALAAVLQCVSALGEHLREHGSSS